MQPKTEALNNITQCIASVYAFIPKVKLSSSSDGQQGTGVSEFIHVPRKYFVPEKGTEVDAITRVGSLGSDQHQFLLPTKIRVFNLSLNSALLYGCETWKSTETKTVIHSCMGNIVTITGQDLRDEQGRWIPSRKRVFGLRDENKALQ